MSKIEALETAIQQINKMFGKGSIMNLSQEAIEKVAAISTGSIGLDGALGIGGVPKGRIIEIFGPESSGKTTLALHIIAEAQKAGKRQDNTANKTDKTVEKDEKSQISGKCAFVDAEHALDTLYASKLGVDIKNLWVAQPETGEKALEIVECLVRSGAFDVIVVDSVAALTPKAEIEGEMGDSHMGLQARLLSQGLRKLTGIVSKTNCIVIFINQIRMKIGVMFGNPETTTGGNALKFYSSVRLDIRKIGAIKDKENIIGNQTRIKVVKNKVAPPFKQVEFDIIYNEGISKIGEMIDIGVENNIIEKSGSYYSYKGERLGQGRENVKKYIQSNTDLSDVIEQEIRALAD